METEEQHRPETVERELNCKQSQRQLRPGKAGPSPHQPGRNRHHQVEQRPDRAEDPVRRIPRGLGDTRVPAADLGRGCGGPQAGGGEADDDGDDETDRLS